MNTKEHTINEILNKAADKFFGHYNDADTRKLIVTELTTQLLPILNEFKIICDETNNPVSVIDSNKLVGRIAEKDPLSVKEFWYDFEFC